MGPIGIRRTLQHRLRRTTTVVAILLCGVALAAHHGGVGLGDAHHDGGVSDAMELCLAAFTAVGAAVVAITVGLIALGRWRPPGRMASVSFARVPPPLPRARAGPALVRLLCVDRR